MARLAEVAAVAVVTNYLGARGLLDAVGRSRLAGTVGQTPLPVVSSAGFSPASSDPGIPELPVSRADKTSRARMFVP